MTTKRNRQYIYTFFVRNLLHVAVDLMFGLNGSEQQLVHYRLAGCPTKAAQEVTYSRRETVA